MTPLEASEFRYWRDTLPRPQPSTRSSGLRLLQIGVREDQRRTMPSCVSLFSFPVRSIREGHSREKTPPTLLRRRRILAGSDAVSSARVLVFRSLVFSFFYSSFNALNRRP